MCNDFDFKTPNDVATLHIPLASTLRNPDVRADMGSLPSTTQFPNGLPTPYSEDTERAAIERLVATKGELRDESDHETFWNRLLQGVASVCDVQCAFIAKRPQGHGDHQPAVNGSETRFQEQTSFPEGIRVHYSCDLGESSQNDCTQILRNISHYLVASDKVTLIPEYLGPVAREHCNGHTTFPMEACLAVPLFSGGRCFAHFGVMWTHEGLIRRHLSWSYLQMILHSLEDLILLRLSTQGAQKNGYHHGPHSHHHRRPSKRKERDWEPTQHRRTKSNNRNSASSHHPATNPASFKPYARSLSHELRTPMQGVVGMLDVMHATVQDTMVTNPESNILSVFQDLRDNIEAVQDSARRAIEAADNVVHAYDLNMQVPESPQAPGQENPQKGDSLQLRKEATNYPRQMVIEGSDISVPLPKRARNVHMPYDHTSSTEALPNNTKTPLQDANPYSDRPILTAEVKSVVEESDKIVHATPQRQMEEVLIDAVAQRPQLGHERPGSPNIAPEPIFPPMVLQHTKIRDLLHLVINESLHVGGRPDSTTAEATDLGERIEIRSRSSSGQMSTKIIDWSVDPAVPETLFFDEKDLAKLVSCIFLNALKFTEAGNITIKTTLNEANRYIMINVCDTGTGIPATFLPKLFQAFAREDGSTTRSKEGLGLGLLVAKGLSRRLGGDLTCVRSSTTEPDRGSEFEIRLPMYPNECVSRPSTPSVGTPAPSPADSGYSPAAAALSPEEESDQQGHMASVGVPVVGEQSSLPDSLCRPQLAPLGTANQGSNDNVSSDYRSSAPLAEPSHHRLPVANRRMSVTSRNSSFLSGHNFDPELAQKQPLTFLVAEDNKINRKILVSMLGKLGYADIYEAFDGKEAVRIMSESLSSSNTNTTTSASASTNSDSDVSSTDTDMSGTGNTAATNTTSPIRRKPIDVILMDLWMPHMDGYEATERILSMVGENNNDNKRLEFEHGYDPLSSSGNNSPTSPTVLAVSADVTDEALRRATAVGMEGYMTKPYKLRDLGRLIMEFCGSGRADRGRYPSGR